MYCANSDSFTVGYYSLPCDNSQESVLCFIGSVLSLIWGNFFFRQKFILIQVSSNSKHVKI